MKEQDRVGHLTESLGYVLKQSAKALHLATEEVLRPFDLTVAQFSCLELLGRHDEAAEAAATAVRLAPHDWRTQVQLAEALTPIKQRLDEAGAAAHRALELAPHESRPHIAAGLVAEANGRRGDAAKAFVRALAIDPHDGAAHANLERVRRGKGKRLRFLPRLVPRIAPRSRG